MKLKLPILLFAATSFLIGCSESQTPPPQEKPQSNTAIKTEPPTAPEEIEAAAPEEIEAAGHEEMEAAAPAEIEAAPSEARKLEEVAKSLAEDLTYEGDKVPRAQLEREIREILEMAKADEAQNNK